MEGVMFVASQVHPLYTEEFIGDFSQAMKEVHLEAKSLKLLQSLNLCIFKDLMIFHRITWVVYDMYIDI